MSTLILQFVVHLPCLGLTLFSRPSPNRLFSNLRPSPNHLFSNLKLNRFAIRKDYEGANYTLGLVVSHAERRIISNPSTGVQFLGKEGNSQFMSLQVYQNC